LRPTLHCVARRKSKQRQSKQRPPEQHQPERLKAPDSDYRDPQGNTLTLRASLTAATRGQYAELLTDGRAASTQDDRWHRAVEFLFERLAVRWEIAGAPIERQRELLARFRVASFDERAWIRDTLREHCAEHFPDVRAP
jgi:hypothetical protein